MFEIHNRNSKHHFMIEGNSRAPLMLHFQIVFTILVDPLSRVDNSDAPVRHFCYL